MDKKLTVTSSLRVTALLAALAGSAAFAAVQPAKAPEKDKPAAAQPADKGKEPEKAKPDAKPDTKADKKDFSIEGYYCEACSCRPPCPCELTGAMMGCKGVGAYQFTSGKYDGEDFSGVRIAYGLNLGEWVGVYIDAKDAKQRAAAEKFARVALAAFGPIKVVKEAKVEMSGKDGAYSVSVDGGKIMKFETAPVMGGDKKTPIVHTNTQDALNSTMFQATF